MHVVLFSYTMREGADAAAEDAATDDMWEIVSRMPGFVSYKAYTAEDGERIAVVRFESREALDAWKFRPEHREIQERARTEWYEDYWVQAMETFREYRYTRSGGYEQPVPREVFLRGARPIRDDEGPRNGTAG
jgi:heme-degrading monooxygenase HmoA